MGDDASSGNKLKRAGFDKGRLPKLLHRLGLHDAGEVIVRDVEVAKPAGDRRKSLRQHPSYRVMRQVQVPQSSDLLQPEREGVEAVPRQVDVLQTGQGSEAGNASEPVSGEVERPEGRRLGARVEPEDAVEAVGCEVDVEEGRGGPEPAGDGATEGVARQVEDTEGGDTAQVHPRDRTAEVAGGEPEGAVGRGRGELKSRDVAEGEGDELAVRPAAGASGRRKMQEGEDKAREGNEEAELHSATNCGVSLHD